MSGSVTSVASPESFAVARLVVPFALGALLTLAITAVNHKRDHIKHVRENLSGAIKDISSKGTAFWTNEYSRERMAQLHGAVTYMQHMLPYATETTRAPEQELKETYEIFVEISDAALWTGEDLNAYSHEIDLQRVTRLLVMCASMEAHMNTLLLRKMSFPALLADSTRDSAFAAVDFGRATWAKFHNTFLVP